eukprot:8689839-Alexandrium_andersonii.AAC.1
MDIDGTDGVSFRPVRLADHPEVHQLIRNLPVDFRLRQARKMNCSVEDITFDLAFAVPITRLGTWYVSLFAEHYSEQPEGQILAAVPLQLEQWPREEVVHFDRSIA